MQESFPDCCLGGCSFHFCQAIWKKCQKLGLTDAYKQNPEVKILIKKVMTLPHLPADQISLISAALFDQPIQVDNETKTKLKKLKNYFNRYWLNIVTAAHLSVHEFNHGTNNFCESYHSRLKSTIRIHRPAIWSFMGHLNNLIRDTELDLQRIDGDLNLTRPKSQKYRKNLENRDKLKAKFTSGQFNAMQYLSAVSHTMDSHLLLLENAQPRLDLGTEDEELENEIQPGAVNEQADSSAPLCSVCLAPRDRTFLLRPCNHASFCADCSAFLQARGDSCPNCRSVIEDRFEIFQN